MNKSEVPSVSLKVGNTVAWVAMNAARNRGFVSSAHHSWTTNYDDKLAVPQAEMLWQDFRPGMHDTCWAFEDSIITVARYRRDVNVSVYTEACCAEEIASQRFQQFKKLMPEAERQVGMLDVSFWYYSQQHGPQSYVRQLEAPSWNSIADNYPLNTRTKIEELLLKKPEDGSGKLILWQGDPGTGKTFAVRALGEEWQSWCRMDYVIDPDNFFMQSDYLLRVILGDGGSVPQLAGGQTQMPMWRLVILEDAGELLAKNARQVVGQGLSRLLNLCEGLLGQGLRVMVLITTNEEVKSLHDAVVRPGRCLSNTSFEKFSSTAANAWLLERGREPQLSKQVTLAEMYAMTKGVNITEKAVAGFIN